jgi:hypothetical protein
MYGTVRKKLGLMESMSTYFMRVPAEYWQALGKKPQPYDDNTGEYDFIHAFFDSLAELDNFCEILLSKHAQDGILWVSLPTGVSQTAVAEVCKNHRAIIAETITVLPQWQAYRLSS